MRPAGVYAAPKEGNEVLSCKVGRTYRKPKSTRYSVQEACFHTAQNSSPTNLSLLMLYLCNRSLYSKN
jgi:hypothetical protein